MLRGGGHMRTLGIGLIVGTVAIAISIGAQTKTDPTLDKLNKELTAAFNAGDAAKVASFYADDALLMPQDAAMVKGRENIEAHYRGEFERIATSIQVRTIESGTSGNVGFEAGTATITMKKSDSPAATPNVTPGSVSGKYLMILKRVGGDWKIAYDIYNLDKALTEKK